MEPLVTWLLTTFGVPGALAVGGFFVWRDIKADQQRAEERYVELIDKTVASHELSRDKFVDLATTTIKSLSDVQASHIRLRDLIDERCPRNGGRP